MSNGDPGDCGSPLCGYGATPNEVGCVAGDGSCWTARLIEAQPSPYHDEQLINATRQIRQTLRGLRAPEGKTLSFVHTPFGTLLAWVSHGVTATGAEVTNESPAEVIISTLGLIIDDDKAEMS